ncbi:hypothetical protein QQX13_02445 [Demequina sp. SYSU T00068]|uniref:hypothetical protein n=1 Tax=Demequina lignilytica TaxID=3051663 RepID=UPI00262D1094|nr:hypothetical protein [Demequina sp. SYSU T00068]MDN4489684.1 hypothetical protein [Demequina sp. SYSU T00068]
MNPTILIAILGIAVFALPYLRSHVYPVIRTYVSELAGASRPSTPPRWKANADTRSAVVHAMTASLADATELGFDGAVILPPVSLNLTAPLPVANVLRDNEQRNELARRVNAMLPGALRQRHGRRLVGDQDLAGRWTLEAVTVGTLAVAVSEVSPSPDPHVSSGAQPHRREDPGHQVAPSGTRTGAPTSRTSTAPPLTPGSDQERFFAEVRQAGRVSRRSGVVRGKYVTIGRRGEADIEVPSSLPHGVAAQFVVDREGRMRLDDLTPSGAVIVDGSPVASHSIHHLDSPVEITFAGAPEFAVRVAHAVQSTRREARQTERYVASWEGAND